MKNVARKGNYVHTIKMRNETEFSEIYDKYKDDIRDHILYSMEGFDFDIDLLVIFKTYNEKKNNISDETTAAATTIKGNRYTIILNVGSLKMIPYDRGLDIALSIKHELGHVYDLYHTMHNKYYSINPLKARHKDFDDFVISKGWGFWTEFYAYYMTYRSYKKEYGYPTFLRLVRGYEKLQTQYEKICTLTDFKAESANAMLESFIDNIKSFAYLFAKHLAGSVMGKPYKYDYCEKTKNREAFEIVNKLEVGLMKKIIPLFTNTYGKGMSNKMYELGKYIIKNLFIKFDIYPIEYYNYIRFAYYP